MNISTLNLLDLFLDQFIISSFPFSPYSYTASNVERMRLGHVLLFILLKCVSLRCCFACTDTFEELKLSVQNLGGTITICTGSTIQFSEILLVRRGGMIIKCESGNNCIFEPLVTLNNRLFTILVSGKGIQFIGMTFQKMEASAVVVYQDVGNTSLMATFKQCTFRNNESAKFGNLGLIKTLDGDGWVKFEDCLFIENQASGGVIYSMGARISLNRCSFYGNTATPVSMQNVRKARLDITNSCFEGNSGKYLAGVGSLHKSFSGSWNNNFGTDNIIRGGGGCRGRYNEKTDVCSTFDASVCSLSMPSAAPSFRPTLSPTTAEPTQNPSRHPTTSPSVSIRPTISPTSQSSSSPSSIPSALPTSFPTALPTSIPTSIPSMVPTSIPSSDPTTSSSRFPSLAPSQFLSVSPSRKISGKPSHYSSNNPTYRASESPTNQPIGLPSGQPTSLPTHVPTSTPNKTASTNPTNLPSDKTVEPIIIGNDINGQSSTSGYGQRRSVASIVLSVGLLISMVINM